MKSQKIKITPVAELKASELCAFCSLEELQFETTDSLEPLKGIIGQRRALKSVRFSLDMKSFGYNLFVAGSPGTGKKTLIRSLVQEHAVGEERPDDILYVANFSQPERPDALKVPAGVGVAFRNDLERLVANLIEDVPKDFKSEDYENRKNSLVQKFQEQRSALSGILQREAQEKGLAIKSSGGQILTVAVVNGHELSPAEYESLPEEEQQKIQQRQAELGETVQDVYRQIRVLQQEAQDRLKELDRTVALISTGHYFDDLRTRYGEFPQILTFLESAQRDMIQNIAHFTEDGEDEEESGTDGEVPESVPAPNPFKRYSVNVVVDNSNQKGAPVISETHPTYRNLVGYAEREARFGTLYTDHTMIRAGSILAANQGYLILDLDDLLRAPESWEALKRALQDGEVRIQDAPDQYGFAGSLGLRPAPVKVRFKAIVLGSVEVYNYLFSVDEDFQKLFKIKSEFDTVVKKDDGHLMEYARFIKTLCDKEQLRHFERHAVARLIEHSSRMVADKTRLTLRFSDVADLIRESSYWASREDKKYVDHLSVQRAIEEKQFRSNLFEERMQEMIDEATILIQSSGDAVGQVNGLSVFQVGDYSFGKPSRVTAQSSVGEKGVVNVEREAGLSGRIHDKGVLILSGYLHGQYGQQQLLSLNSSVCFEQSYSGVDGDSASSTELYAIISSLAGIPLRQSIAVTGSINQKGVIQPIGGVNEKIEGFFHTCKSQGLNGEQGVIIPHQNVQNLVLKREVIDAVEAGQFHVYPIQHVNEGLEILSGLVAGERQPDGHFPEGTIHWMVQGRLDEMAEIAKQRRR